MFSNLNIGSMKKPATKGRPRKSETTRFKVIGYLSPAAFTQRYYANQLAA
ncbi:MAG: hypothetical protein M0Z99_00405 [Betaproteobacteria bacterium]|nr:hypothetical protein [Betaproteobacteria bacterium]